MTLVQIIALLKSMGFTNFIIAAVLGITVIEVEQSLANNTSYLYCIGLYGAYKTACASAGACNGTADPAKCNEYRLNFLGHATCAILRSKHMDKCIPGRFRHVWDPDGGHGIAIKNAWNAAAKCATKMAEAGCPPLPTLTPPNVPGIGPLVPFASCTVGSISYADSACPSCLTPAIENYLDPNPPVPDQAWIDAELIAP